MSLFSSFLALVILALPSFSFAHTEPNSGETPGMLCSQSDPNFEGFFYSEKIARCKRNVGEPEKAAVAQFYQVPKNNWPNYEFDHLIPLCAGGSNDPRNLWPQPITEAHDKDKVENEVCIAMQNGTMTQADAIKKIQGWISGGAAVANDLIMPEFFFPTER